MLKKREALIGETIVFLNSISVEIGYSRTNIVKIICKLSEEKTMDNLIFLKTCVQRIEEGAEFPEAWNSAVSSASLYKREEKEKLLHLGSFLGTSDCENQINTIKIYSSFFEKYHCAAEEEYNRYGKLSALFGLFFGAAVFILLF